MDLSIQGEASMSLQDTLAPRARRRARLADELEAVALELFASRGFHSVTVNEIATTADISTRTFFRYFAAKEEVVLGSIVQRIDTVVTTLSRRPPEEPTISALRSALAEVADVESFAAGKVDRWRAAVIIAEPAIAERGLQLLMGKHDEMTAIVASRMGVDPKIDLRPGVVTAAMVGALTAGWHAGVARGRVDQLSCLAGQALDLLVPVLAPLVENHQGGPASATVVSYQA